ncbi:mitochondrial phosphate carrier protein 3 mitochondrial [Tripterygium wilfordii]|uniref:Mitochondrial phosphate carrier protein 3 mitochondrial n=1 Tax=Tripterygium wilfordii TaxID=458696 RepID=A0A7J7DRC8_TRIWF|nr:mitochondrial phosphate carrier protein 3 mitochondrial [Tripterygium wilfordii]
MVLSDSSRQSMIPSFLYPSSSTKSFSLLHTNHNSNVEVPSPSSSVMTTKCHFSIPSPSEPGKIEMYSPAFYAACTIDGILSCGLTHMAVTPVDLFKCNMHIDPAKYKSISSGFEVLLKEQGIRAAKYKTLIYLAGSASAEVIADIALCPFEAVKVRVQTQPGFARGLSDGLPKFVKSEGALGYILFLPDTMMKFASFETIVELMYKHVIPAPKDQCSKPLQLGISFAGGYVYGVLSAIVSHPADNLVSFLNNTKGATAVKKLGLRGLFTRGLPLRNHDWYSHQSSVGYQ